MRVFFLVFVSVLLGCHSNYFRNEPENKRFLDACAKQNQIKGSPAQFTLVSGEASGIYFDAPKFCPDNSNEQGAYIRVTHTGERRLDYKRSEATECDKADADPVQCSSVSIHIFGMAVLTALRQDLGELNADSFGLGVCASSGDPFEQWNLSCRIHDWGFANRAVYIVYSELARWNIGGEFGLSITSIPCAVVELASGPPAGI